MKKAKPWIKSILITLVISTGFALFTQWINKPEFRLNELADAIAKKDYSQFKTLANQEVLVNNIYKTNKDKYVPHEEDDLFSAIGKYFNLGKATITEGVIKDDINLAIEIYFTDKIDELHILDSKLMEFILGLDLKTIKIGDSVYENERLAMLSFTIDHKIYEHTFIFNSVWEKFGNDWKMVNISNAAEIADTWKSLEVKRRNDTITKKTMEMMRFLEISEYQGQTKDFWIFNWFQIFRSKHTFILTNMTNQTVVEFGVRLSYKDNQGYVFIQTSDTFTKPIGPHEKVKVTFWSYDPLVHGEMMVGNAPSIDYTYIKLENGQNIKNNENLDPRFFE